MRILLVNKFHYLKGGSEKYYFELGELLKEHGHDVAYFSMENDKNIQTGDKEYFVPAFDLNNSSKLKALDVIYNKENEKIMEKALDDFKPDIVHLNNFQRQLSASIIKPITKRNIPIVFTAHDVQAICPAITMLDSNNEVCEKCIGGKYINCIKKSCVKGSKLKSVLGAIENKYYRNHKIYFNKINKIITPSEFYKTRFIKDGFNDSKVIALHNFVDLKLYNIKTKDKGYALYFGRLSKEKGILNLIEAFAKLNNGELYIAGDGPEKDNIIDYISKNKLDKRVKLLGFLNSDEMKKYISECKFVVVPSVWYENCPYSVMETLAIGKPVIGADIGGIPELVKNKKSGLTYKSYDINELSKNMKKLFEDDKLVKEYGENAKKQAKDYAKDKYYDKIIKVYEEAVMEMK